MSTIVFALPDEELDSVEIPSGIESLDEFRRWAFSKQFPESGRIDYVAGRIEVDFTHQDLFWHNVPRTELACVLADLVKRRQLGWLFSRGVRVSCPDAPLSVEPDLVYVSEESYDSGAVTFRKSTSRGRRGFAEILGPPDLVVELISDSSVRKDTQLLPQAYFAAGVKELWVLDCRGEGSMFEIFVRGARKFRAVKPGADGYRRSEVLGATFRLQRTLTRPDVWSYDLQIRSNG